MSHDCFKQVSSCGKHPLSLLPYSIPIDSTATPRTSVKVFKLRDFYLAFFFFVSFFFWLCACFDIPRFTIATSSVRGGIFSRRLSRASAKNANPVTAAGGNVSQAGANDGDDKSSGIELHCAQALTREFTPEQQGERAKTVMQSSPRMPAVGFFGGKYGDRWYIDIVALTHNAVRRQLFDAFMLSNALGKLLLDVTEVDLARVYAWLGTLDKFVRIVFEVENRFVYPLIDTHVRNATTADGQPVYLPELLSTRGRTEARTHVCELLDAARKTRDVATGEISAKIHALRYALDQFGGSILDYFAAMERFGPKLLKKAVKNGAKEKIKLERKLFDYIREEGDTFAALLMQCIESRSKRAEFLERNIKKDKARMEFRAHVKNVESTHMQLARMFDSVAAKYERKFDVKKFMEHYDASTDATKTLEMFGNMDINYENSTPTKAQSSDVKGLECVQFHNSDDVNASPIPAQVVTVSGDDDVIEMPDDNQTIETHINVTEIHSKSTDLPGVHEPAQDEEEDFGDGLDDDVLEIRATEEDALAMESRRQS